MATYVIFDVEIRDAERWQQFAVERKPVLAAAGARYLARGGAFKVHEADWTPRRLSLLEFPSQKAFEDFYYGADYQRLIAVRNKFSSGRFVSVEGLPAVRMA